MNPSTLSKDVLNPYQWMDLKLKYKRFIYFQKKRFIYVLYEKCREKEIEAITFATDV